MIYRDFFYAHSRLSIVANWFQQELSLTFSQQMLFTVLFTVESIFV